jgi:hypothetical protein
MEKIDSTRTLMVDVHTLMIGVHWDTVGVMRLMLTGTLVVIWRAFVVVVTYSRMKRRKRVIRG